MRLTPYRKQKSYRNKPNVKTIINEKLVPGSPRRGSRGKGIEQGVISGKGREDRYPRKGVTRGGDGGGCNVSTKKPP